MRLTAFESNVRVKRLNNSRKYSTYLEETVSDEGIQGVLLFFVKPKMLTVWPLDKNRLLFSN